MATPVDPKSGLTFMSNLGAGAIWTGLPLADASEPSGVKADTAPVDDPRRLWIWSPHQLLSFEGTSDNINLLTAAGWEPMPGRTIMGAGLPIYHLWTQLRELRGVQVKRVQIPGQPPGEDKEIWVRTEDLRAVERYPVALAFAITSYPADKPAIALFARQRAQGEPFHAWVPETLPPPTLGTRGLVWTEGDNAGEHGPGWQRYDLEDLPPAARELQERLAEALRELATPHSWYAVGLSTQKALEVVAEPFGYERHKQAMQAQILATSGRLRDTIREALADMDTARERLEQMRRAARKYPPDIWLERWGEIQQMAQDLAAAYWEHHQSLLQPAVAPTQARQLPMAISVFRNEHALIPSHINVLQLIQGLSSSAWPKREDTGTPYWRGETRTGREDGENASTEMELRPEDMQEPSQATQEQVNQLWELTRARSDLDGDLFLAMWAQHLSASKDSEGYVSFTGDLFLDYRGITPITREKTPGGPPDERWRAGHRVEDKQDVSAALWRQMAVWVKVRAMLLEAGDQGASKGGKPRKRARRLYTHESRLWLVPEVIRQHELTGVASDGGSSHIVAWRYKPGTWAAPFLAAPNLHFAQLCQTALQYDPLRERWEKRLARYFVFHLRISGGPNYGGTSITRTIGDLLTELELPRSTEDPKRTRQRFERALARLAADGIIDTWNYASDNPELPRRNWLPVWEQWHVRVKAAPLSTSDLLDDASDQTSGQGPTDA